MDNFPFHPLPFELQKLSNQLVGESMTKERTVNDLRHLMLATAKTEATHRSYEWRTRFFAEMWGDLPVGEITFDHISTWYKTLLDTDGYSAVSLTNLREGIKVMFNLGVKAEWLTVSPALWLKGGKYQGERSQPPEGEPVDKMLTVARHWINVHSDLKHTRHASTFLLIYVSGARSVSLSRMRTASVIKALSLDPPDGVFRIYTEDKGGETSTIRFNREVARALRKYAELRPETDSRSFFLSANRVDGGYKALPACGIANGFRTLSKEAGVHPSLVTPHKLRHMIGDKVTKLLGTNVAQKFLNHKDPETTYRFYGHASEADVVQAMGLLNDETHDTIAQLFSGGRRKTS